MKRLIIRTFLSWMCLSNHQFNTTIKWKTITLSFTISFALILSYFTLHHVTIKSVQINRNTRHGSETSNQLLPDTSPHQTIKRILFWTTYFNWKDFQFGMGQEPFLRAGCRVTNCMTTDDRTLLNESDAILFHPINYDPINDAPRHRLPHQRYVFLFYEAEISGRLYPVFQPPTPKGFFNWTMTYRRDSDIYSPQPYGILRRKNSTNIDTLPVALNAGMLPFNPATFLQTMMTITWENSITTNKTKKIAWFVSKCKTTSRREIFFRRLFDFFPQIDVYGECGSKGLDCVPWNSLECDTILADYKFYIAAENSFCPDYVTEKFYRALQVGAVPIVYGGADYSAYAPPNSFIHAADFRSPKALAEYLILLDENPNFYARYFEWRRDWMVDRQPFDGWCDLCEKLNEPIDSSKSYDDIGKWWFDAIPCVPTSSLKNLSHS